MRPVKISPSMMCANFLELQKDVDVLKDNEIAYYHIDVMDGSYVPNFTIGIDYCKALQRASDLPFDIHLMVENVDLHIPMFAGLTRPRISFHPETSKHPLRTIDMIKSLGASPGICIDPAIPIEQFRHIIPAVDQVCLMTVNPGFAGQKLVKGSIEKIAELRHF